MEEDLTWGRDSGSKEEEGQEGGVKKRFGEACRNGNKEGDELL